MASNPQDTNAELAEAYRKFEAAHKAGDREAAKRFKSYAQQLEGVASGGGALPQEVPPDEAGPALSSEPPKAPGGKTGGGATALKLGGVRMVSNYLSGRERERQQREKAVAHVKSRMPKEWLPEFEKIHNKSDFKALDDVARIRFGKKYDELIAQEEQNPEVADLIKQARGSDATNLYDSIIRPYFSKDGPDLAADWEGKIEKVRGEFTEKQRTAIDKPWLAEGAEFFKPGSWFDETTKAPWHDPHGFYLSVAEQVPNLLPSIVAARTGGTLGARGALGLIKGATGRNIELVRKVAGRGAKVGGTAAGTVTEGVMIRDQVGQEVYDRMMDLDDETWKTSEDYQRLRDGGLTDTEAKQIVSAETSMKAGNTAMVVSGAMGAPASAYFGSLGSGLASRSFVKNVTKGALMEAGPEGVQEATESVIGNLGVRRVDPDQDVFEGAGEAFVGGAFTSAPIGALGGMTESRKGSGISKENQATLDAIQPWEKAASARWKLQNRLSNDDLVKNRSPEEVLAEIGKLEDLQQKEATAFLKAEPVMRRSMLKNNAPDEDLKRLDIMKASANTMLTQVAKARETRTDARKDAEAARKGMKERQEIVDAVQQDVLKRDDLNRIAMNIERVRDQEALSETEYAELEELGYGKFVDNDSRFHITQKGVRAIPELMTQLKQAEARIGGLYTGEERRKDSKLRERMDNMTPEQREAAIYRDPTTKVLNRRAFDEAEHAPAYAEVDVDSLKWVNDNMSVETGDRLIRRVAEVLQEQEGVTVYRLGGDEFGVTGESEEQLEQALQRARMELDDTQPLTEGRQSIVPAMTWAVGKNRKEVTAKVTKQKAQREKTGRRAARGEKPPGYRDLQQRLLLHRDGDEASLLTEEELAQLDEEAERLSRRSESGFKSGLEVTSRVSGKTFRFGDLPINMREEINRFAKSHGTTGQFTNAEYLPLYDVPIEKLASSRTPSRTRTIAEDVPMDDLPPIVIARKKDGSFQFIDGLHRVELATKRGIKTIRAVDVGALVTEQVHGRNTFTLGNAPAVRNFRTGDVRPAGRSTATYRDFDIREREGGYPPVNDHQPGVFPSNRLIIPTNLYNEINPEDFEFVLDGNGKLAIPAYIAADIYEQLSLLSGVENDHQVVTAVHQLPGATLKQGTITAMRSKNNRGAVSVRQFNSMLLGISMIKDGLTAETVKGKPAMGIGPTFELERSKNRTPKRPAVKGNIWRDDTFDWIGQTKTAGNYGRGGAYGYSGGYGGYGGTSNFGFGGGTYSSGNVISRETADVLRTKKLTCIWCNADQYIEENKLSGFSTGMFISETSEARIMNVEATQAQVDESNRVFSEIAAKHIDKDEDAMYEAIISEYEVLAESNPVVKYNIKEIRDGQRISNENREHMRPDPGAGNKTLVIHPKDKTTDFLKAIYAGHPEWTVVTGDKTIEEVKIMIADHDRVLMMGHGSPGGLMSVGQFTRKQEPYTPTSTPSYTWKANDKEMAQAQGVVDGLYAGVPGLPPIKLVRSPEELPAGTLKELLAMGSSLTGVRGMFQNDVSSPDFGTIFIVVGNIWGSGSAFDKNVAETVLHELVGHYGLRGLSGSEKVLARIADVIVDSFSEKALAAGDKGKSSIRIKFSDGTEGTMYTSETMARKLFPGQAPEATLADPVKRALVGEELFAYLTGETLAKNLKLPAPQLTALQRAIKLFKDWMIRLGFGRWVRMSDRDVQSLIASAQDFVRSGRHSAFVVRTGQRKLIQMRDAEIFKAGIISAIESGTVTKPRNQKEKQIIKDGGVVPLFSETNSINGHLQSFLDGVAMKHFTENELVESNIFSTLKTNPIEWTMRVVGRDMDTVAHDLDVPKADLEKMWAFDAPITPAVAEKIVTYIKASIPAVMGMPAEQAIATNTALQNRLNVEAIQSGTVMTYGELAELIDSANEDSHRDPAVRAARVEDLVPENLRAKNLAERAQYETDKAAYAAELQRAIEQHRKRPIEPKEPRLEDLIVDPSKVTLDRATLRALVDKASMPTVVPWQYGVAYDRSTAATEVNENIRDVPGREAGPNAQEISDELRLQSQLGFDVRQHPVSKRWLDYSGRRSPYYANFVHVGGTGEYRETLFFQPGGTGDGIAGHFGNVSRSDLEANTQFAHVRQDVALDGSDNPPQAPNPKYQGKTSLMIEMQSDLYQRKGGSFESETDKHKAMAEVSDGIKHMQRAMYSLGMAIGNRVSKAIASDEANTIAWAGNASAQLGRAAAVLVSKSTELANSGNVLMTAGDARVEARNKLVAMREFVQRLQGNIDHSRSYVGAYGSRSNIKELINNNLLSLGTALRDYTQVDSSLMLIPESKQELAKILKTFYESFGLDEAALLEDLNAMDVTGISEAMVPSSVFTDNAAGDANLQFAWNNMDMDQAFYEGAFTQLRSGPYAGSFMKSSMGNGYKVIYTGKPADFDAALAAYKEAFMASFSDQFAQQWGAASGKMVQALDRYPTTEQLMEWLDMVEYKPGVEGYEEVFIANGYTTDEDVYVSDLLGRMDADDFVDDMDWGNPAYFYEGQALDENHEGYRSRVEQETDEDGDETGEEDTDEAERWLRRRRVEMAEGVVEPGGAIYEREAEKLRLRYRNIAIYKGTLKVGVTEAVVQINKDIDTDMRLRIQDEEQYPRGNYYFRNDLFAEHVTDGLRAWMSKRGLVPADAPWGNDPYVNTAPNARAVAEKILTAMEVKRNDQIIEAAGLRPRIAMLQAQIDNGVRPNSPFGRDDQWKIIVLRYLISDAVRRGIPKIQYAGGEASTKRGAIPAEWKSYNKITWSLENLTYEGRPKDYYVIRAEGIAPIVLTPDNLIPVIGKDAALYMERQTKGEAPRSMTSTRTEPSREDLLVSSTLLGGNSVYIVTRVGSDNYLGVARNKEELDSLTERLVNEAKARGGWGPGTAAPSAAAAAANPTEGDLRLPAAPPADAQQWGEITAKDIGGHIQIISPSLGSGFVSDPGKVRLMGSRRAYDVITRRMWNKELKKYGSVIKPGYMKIDSAWTETALKEQGFHKTPGIPKEITDRFGNIEVAEMRGDQAGFAVLGRDGPILQTLFRTRQAADSAMEEWIRDNSSGTGMTNVLVWEFEVTEKMREVFSKPITPFHFDQYSDPILKEAAEKIGSRAPSLRARYQSWRSNWKHSFTQGSLDRFYGIKKAMKDAGLSEVMAEENGYIQARLSTSLDSVMRSIMEFGHPVWRDGIMQTEGTGLIDILQPVASNVELWAMYMAGVRAKRLLTGGSEAVWREVLNPNTSAKRKAEIIKNGRERMWTPEQIDRMVSLGDTYPVFKRVAAEYAAFHKQVLDFAQEAGTINPETRAMWENADYIPFYRVQDDRIIGPMSSTSGIANVSSPVKTLKGGTDNVGDLMHNIMINLTKLMDGAMKNHAALTTVDALRPSGIVSNQPMAWSEQIIPMEQVKKALKERGVDPDTIPEEALTGFQKMFALQAPKGEGIISVMRSGKKEFYQTSDPLLYRAMTAINKQYFGNWMQMLRAPKRLLTTWITLDPGFMIANYIRDALSSFVISRDRIVPMVGGVVGFAKALGQSEEMRTMMSSGAAFENGYINQYDPESTKRLLKRSFKSSKPTDIMLDSPRKLYELWKRIGAATENANRIAVYRAAIAAGKSKAQAAFESKDLMDFSMSGDWGVIQFLVQTVPFLGARIQGLHRLGRSFNENPVATTFKGALVGFAGMALWLAFKDDERYKDLEDWDKDTYFHFWIGENHYRLPKPFEVGAIFNTIPERIFEAINSEETDAGKLLLRRFGFVISEMFNMNPIPQAAQPMVETWFNYNFFTRSQIESPYEEQRLPPERYRYNTSPTMIEIARHLPAGIDTVSGKIRSPLQLQNLYLGYTGTLGRYFLMGADALVREAMDLPAPPERAVADWPVVGRFFRGDEPRRTRYEEEFYNTLRRAIQAQGSVKFLKDVDEEQRIEYVEGKYEPYIEVSSALESARDRISEINKRMRKTHMDRDLTPKQKREEIDALQVDKNEIFKEAYALRPGGKDNLPKITPEKISFFLDKFNRDEPPSPEMVKTAPATADLLVNVGELSGKQLQSLARASGTGE